MCDDGTENRHAVVQTTITTDPGRVEDALVETVAELDDIDVDDMPDLYDTMDHIIGLLFHNPPCPEAQIDLGFSYAGHRIELTQNGTVMIYPVKMTYETE